MQASRPLLQLPLPGGRAARRGRPPAPLRRAALPVLAARKDAKARAREPLLSCLRRLSLARASA